MNQPINKPITSVFFKHLKREAARGDIKISFQNVNNTPCVNVLDLQFDDADKALRYVTHELSKVVDTESRI